MIDERVKIQETRRQNIIISENEIDEALAHLEAQNGLPAGGFKRVLADQKIPYKTLREQTAANLGWLKVLQRVGKRVTVSPAEIKAREKIIRKELARESLTFAEIVVKMEEEAGNVLQRLQNGADFRTMVELYSVADSRLEGGQIDGVTQDYYGSAGKDVLAALLPGQLSQPIKIKDGYAIVLMLNKREPVQGDSILIWELAQAVIPPDKKALQALGKTVENGCFGFQKIVQADAVPGTYQIGQVSPTQLPEELAPLLKEADFERVIGPVQTPLGLLFFMKCGAVEKRVMPTEQELRAQIETEKIELISQQLLSELKRDVVVEYK